MGVGVFVYGDDVFYICIFDFWFFWDLDGDGVVEFRKLLLIGYGVCFVFCGYDMYGLIIGLDGWFYFSIGDWGYNVVIEFGEFIDLVFGVVFCCEFDGFNFEVVVIGLCNL